jgi:hypothetical protein
LKGECATHLEGASFWTIPLWMRLAIACSRISLEAKGHTGHIFAVALILALLDMKR